MDDGPPAGCIAGFIILVLSVAFYAIVIIAIVQWLLGIGPFVRSSV